jgi:hypothetical protein
MAVGAGASSAEEQRFWAAVDDADLTALTEVVGVQEQLRPRMPLADALALCGRAGLLSSWRRDQGTRRSCRGAERELAGRGSAG